MKPQNPRGPVAPLDSPARAVEDRGDVVALDLLKKIPAKAKLDGQAWDWRISRPPGGGEPTLSYGIGVDTPETVDPRRPVGCYGEEASAFTHRRLAGRTVHLTFDRQRRDRYGRLLAYVEVDGRRFNDELLTGGYARLLVIPPNGLHGRGMLDEELAARSAGRGLWGACPEREGR